MTLIFKKGIFHLIIGGDFAGASPSAPTPKSPVQIYYMLKFTRYTGKFPVSIRLTKKGFAFSQGFFDKYPDFRKAKWVYLSLGGNRRYVGFEFNKKHSPGAYKLLKVNNRAEITTKSFFRFHQISDLNLDAYEVHEQGDNSATIVYIELNTSALMPAGMAD